MITKNKGLIIGAASLVAAVCVGTGVGCYFGGVAVGENRADNVVTYVSAESAVYSSTSEVVSAVADTVVEIRTGSIITSWGKQYIVSGAGSGVIVGYNGADRYYIITNNHVIEGADDITVTLRSGSSYNATLVATDVAGDIAVITVEETRTLAVALWGNSDQLQIGEDLIAIGNPLGELGGTVTKGILSATQRAIAVGDYYMTLLQTDTAINPGNSGGGLFNMRGELIGVVNAKTSDEEVEGICFAIPANTAKDIYSELITDGYVSGRATLDISVSVVSDVSGNNTHLYISALGADADAQFHLYDKIVSINGYAVNSKLTYNAALASAAPNDSVEVVVNRGAMRQTMFGQTISFDNGPVAFTVTLKQLK